MAAAFLKIRGKVRLIKLERVVRSRLLAPKKYTIFVRDNPQAQEFILQQLAEKMFVTSFRTLSPDDQASVVHTYLLIWWIEVVVNGGTHLPVFLNRTAGIRLDRYCGLCCMIFIFIPKK